MALSKHGINFPIFSLRSKQGGGIGEYPDLLLLIEWLKDSGMSVLQILPINDPGIDSSPYNALSAFALNPLFLRYEGFYDKDLNEKTRIDYPEVREKKEAYFLKEIFPNFNYTSDFKYWVEGNPWVHAYAQFKALKKKYSHAFWRSWASFDISPEEMKPFIVQQYLCHKQMSEVKKAAEENGIEIVGDIPILISPDSVDVWTYPQIFNTDLEAGAPPDLYNSEGQNWGFPLYRWDILEHENFRWWRERLLSASAYFHSYRIDHIIGFYRIWAIEKGKPATQGYFIPQDEHLWIPTGEKLLKMMTDTTLMRPIGEDLGVVPDEVRASLGRLGIPGMKVLRWERYWHGDKSFIPYDQYPELSLTCVSTHDSALLREWWETCPNESEPFCQFKNWVYTPKLTDDMIKNILHDSHSTPSRYHVNLLTEYLSMIPELRYDNPFHDRINLPGVITDDNWSFRMKPFLEDMKENKSLNDAIKTILPS